LSRRTHGRVRAVAATACCAALLTTPVFAQSRRPYRGLFGPAGKDAAQVLAVNGAMGIGYDTNVMAEQREHGVGFVTDSLVQTADTYSVFGGGLTYSDYSERYDFGASFQSVMRDYSRFATVSAHTASVSGTLRAGRRTTLSIAQSGTYQPLGLLFRLPTIVDPGIGQVVEPNTDLAVVHGAYTTYSTTAGASHQLSRRASVSTSYTYSAAQTGGIGATYKSQQGSIRYQHGLTRHAAWHAGYGYTNVRYPGGGQLYRGNSIDTGLDYSRELSLTRRTTLSFGSGVMGIKDRNLENRNATRYQAVGSATLRREIGRTWMAAAVYTRGVEFFETIRAPYMYDGLTLALVGLVSRRVQLHSTAGATYGSLAPYVSSSGASRFATVYGNAGMLFALSRYAGIAADYIFYAYSLDDVSLLTQGSVRPELTRHSVMISLRAWVPVLERGRRPNASR
jgi:hypothetical protein